MSVVNCAARVGIHAISVDQIGPPERTRVSVTLSNKNATPAEEANALPRALEFSEADTAAYKEQYGIYLIDAGMKPVLPSPTIPTPPLSIHIEPPILQMILTQASKQLADNMIAANVHRPPGTAAHHIVAFKSYKGAAVPAQLVLAKFGIDINSAENGVFLPDKPNVPAVGTPMYHRDLHTKRYYDEVNLRLAAATTKEEAIELLDEIRTELLNGTFPR